MPSSNPQPVTAVNVQKPQFTVYRKLGTLSHSAFNQDKTIDLDRLHGLRFIDLYMSLVSTGSAGAADGAYLTSGPAQIMRAIQLKGNGKEPIFDTTGYGNFLQNLFDYHISPSSTQPSLASFGSGAATTEALLRLDLALQTGKVPIDTALITSLFTTLQLRVTLGDKTDLVNATNDRTITFTSATIDVYVGEIVNFRADLFGRVIAKHYFIEQQPASSSAANDLLLPVGNAYRSIILEIVAPNANPTPVNTVLNNLQVKSGSEIFVDVKASPLRRAGCLERGIAEQTGAYLVDFSRDGLLGENLDVSRVNNLKLTLDITLVAGNRLRAHCIELIVL